MGADFTFDSSGTEGSEKLHSIPKTWDCAYRNAKCKVFQETFRQSGRKPRGGQNFSLRRDFGKAVVYSLLAYHAYLRDLK